MSEAVKAVITQQLRVATEDVESVWSKDVPVRTSALLVMTREPDVKAATVASTVTPAVIR
jgi:hypothetical protein